MTPAVVERSGRVSGQVSGQNGQILLVVTCDPEYLAKYLAKMARYSRRDASGGGAAIRKKGRG